MRRKITIALAVIGVIIIGIVLYKVNLSMNQEKNEITITKYNPKSGIVIKKVIIDSEEEIIELEEYSSLLNPVSDFQMVDLAILREVEVEYNGAVIRIQLNEKSYCYYTNKAKGISSICRIPEGLFEWVEDKLSDSK